MKKKIVAAKKKIVAVKKIIQSKKVTVKKFGASVKKVAHQASDKSKQMIKKIQELSHQAEPMLKIVKEHANTYGKIAGKEIITLAEHLRALIHEWTAAPIKKK